MRMSIAFRAHLDRRYHVALLSIRWVSAVAFAAISPIRSASHCLCKCTTVTAGICRKFVAFYLLFPSSLVLMRGWNLAFASVSCSFISYSLIILEK